jgi:hypothetical protein
MARFEYTRTVSQYYFRPPESISLDLYNSYKSLLRDKPMEDLMPKDNVGKKNTIVYALVIIGFALTAVGIALEIWLLVFLSVWLILHPLVNMGTLQSSVNQDRAERARRDFYRDLKEMITQSSSYYEFEMLYKKKYSSLYSNPYT